MDQLKPALEFLKKYGFWISVALILLCSIGIWFKVTGDLVAESDTRAQTIRAEIQQVSDIRNVLPEHPNSLSHERMEAMIAVRQEEVLAAWTAVFDKQKDILVWPEKELTKDLIDQYRDKIPIESYIHFPILEEEKLPTALLQQYAAYIDKVLPNLAQIAKAEWTAKFGVAAGGGGRGGMGMGGMGGMEMGDMGMGMDGGGGGVMMGGGRPGLARSDIDLLSGMKKGPLVRWSQAAQAGLIKELFPWEGRRPTTLEVYYSQENLWILRQLLTIIAEVNGAAKQPFEAKIREIKQLSMGSRVRFTAGNLAVPSGAAMGRGMGGVEMEMDMGMGPADMGMSPEMEMDMGMGPGGGMDGGMRTSMEEVDPADNRYVDDKREPITGEQLRAAFESESAEDAKLKVAKRVPVMISVQIDQRAVPELLAACSSAPLMVEVIQTRMFGDAKAAAAAAAASQGRGGGGGGPGMGMAMGGGGAMGMDGGMEMEMDGGMGMGGGASGRAQSSDQFPLDVTVEVYGLIHIYNPPEEDKLGVDQITADTVIDGETMGEQVEKEKTGGNVAAPDAALPPPLPAADPTTEPAPTTPPAAGTTPPAAGAPPPAAGTTPPAAGAPAPAASPENPGNATADPVQPAAPTPQPAAAS